MTEAEWQEIDLKIAAWERATLRAEDVGVVPALSQPPYYRLRAALAMHAPITLTDAASLGGPGSETPTLLADLARLRVAYADAMLAELAKPKP